MMVLYRMAVCLAVTGTSNWYQQAGVANPVERFMLMLCLSVKYYTVIRVQQLL